MQLLINAEDYAMKVIPGTYSQEDRVNNRGLLSVSMVLEPAESPEVGSEVLVYDDQGTKIFGGLLAKIKMVSNYTEMKRIYSLVVADYTRYAERRTVANSYSNKYQGEIVEDILTSKLAQYGISEGLIDEGLIIEIVGYNYMKVSSIFDELASMNGQCWYIDYDKKLYFIQRSQFEAPFGLNPLNSVYRDFKSNATDEAYRNVQILRAGRDFTDERTEEFVGDGTRRTFTLTYPVYSLKEITVNGTPQSFGYRQQDTGKIFYYEKESANIEHSSDYIPLTSGYTIAVTYRGLYPIVVMARDDDEIDIRADMEGAGDGVFEAIENDASIDSRELAFQKATALLRYYGKIQKEVTYTTFTPGLKAGMLQSINLPLEGVDSSFLITAVTTSEMANGSFAYNVTAVDGENFGGWLKFFMDLKETGRNFVIRGNEVFVILSRHREYVQITDELTFDAVPIFAVVGPYAIVGEADVYTEDDWP